MADLVMAYTELCDWNRTLRTVKYFQTTLVWMHLHARWNFLIAGPSLQREGRLTLYYARSNRSVGDVAQVLYLPQTAHPIPRPPAARESRVQA